jgi:hypothetical protein
VNFILIGISYSGHKLGENSPETEQQLGEAVVGNTINLCRNSQLILSEEEVDLIRQWILSGL